ncbi:FtsW/RodA/SpoVE family cell cycle protein [Clostridium grantii]|uniref:Cell division protein FtsW, lipid II flippase n=1 Tax=Clostridium grantii DSM 8605 TaxID=1121316 RepID=A0A1M5WQB3_9CLOT|nr:FtsW/RodA/SpoVE family cell cycle protein [Clostridium grantii]SHH89334.1 cell division protein FtsW, lipid II flippase [Clostridium grantii DSM 8605]
MNKYVSEFLEKVCTEVKYKKIHPELSRELQGHIDELISEYIDKGMSEEEASTKAVKQMGDPFEIGKELNNTHKPKAEWSIIALIIAMISIGGITFFSFYNSNYIYTSLGNYIAYLSLSIILFTACYLFDYTKIEKYSLHIFILTLISFVFLLFSPIFTVRVNGVPFLQIGPFTVSLPTIVIPLLLVSFAGLLNKWATGSIKDMSKLIALALLSILLFTIIPSAANIIILSCSYMVMLSVAIKGKNFKRNSKKSLIYFWGSTLTLILLSAFSFIVFSPYRVLRLLTFFDPYSNPNGAGYQYVVLNKLISSSKLFGSSNNLYIRYNGTNQLALQDLHTELVFTYIVSAFGYIAGSVVLIIFTLTIIRMFLATKKIYSYYGKYLASSIVTVFSVQVITNILMNLGILPIVGISLPFISYGGSNFMTNMILLGLLLNVYRRKDLVGLLFPVQKKL